MERNKVTVNGILQSVYLKNLKVLTVKARVDLLP